MLQNFYFTDKRTWSSFNKIIFGENEDKDIFFGISKFYFSLIESKYVIALTESGIKLSLIISLAEIYIKNNKRYQSESEYKDGIGMMQNIQSICNLIRNS